ncbi:MAG TPA: hypothetical protein ENJ01_10180 [Gammaproteobacteria bacterium]|nr:hypothetical protein [Gammaproteobacteria bacterium]
MYNRLLVFLIFLPGLFAIGNVQAAGFAYDYAQISFDDVDFDVSGFNVDGDGITLSGSYAFHPDYFVTAAWGNWDLDGNVDGRQLTIGVGLHSALRAQTDLVLDFVLGNIELDSGTSTFDNDFWRIGVALRHNLSNQLEVGAAVNYYNFDIGDNDTAFGFNALYNLTNDVSALAAIEFRDDVDILSIGIRYYY